MNENRSELKTLYGELMEFRANSKPELVAATDPRRVVLEAVGWANKLAELELRSGELPVEAIEPVQKFTLASLVVCAMVLLDEWPRSRPSVHSHPKEEVLPAILSIVGNLPLELTNRKKGKTDILDYEVLALLDICYEWHGDVAGEVRERIRALNELAELRLEEEEE